MTVQIDDLAVRAAFSQPDDDGTFQGDFANYLKDISSQRPVVLLPFAPKAAGTFLRTAVIAATGGQLVRAVHAQGGREAQLYLPIFVHYYYGGMCEGPMVVHAHMQAHPANCRFIEALSLKPVVMIRSITDMLASMWDMYMNDPAMRPEAVNCMLPEDFPDFAQDVKADFMFDMFAPWYVSYYASWMTYSASHSDTVLVLRYNDLLSDPAGLLGQILNHVSLPQPPEICAAALKGTWDERGELRFSRGVGGRGRDYFAPEHFARLERMLGRYAVLRGIVQELI